MDWIANHWGDMLAVWVGVVTVASAIVKVTPTQTDDRALFWVLKIFETIAMNNKPVEKRNIQSAAKARATIKN